MTRRSFLAAAIPATCAAAARNVALDVPVHRVFDTKLKGRPAQMRYFNDRIWPEAVRDFARCGIRLSEGSREAEVWAPEGREPVIGGLERTALNLVLTDQIPQEWDRGRALNGVTTMYRGHHLCMVALRWAHCHRVPLVGVNTCVHELLHALLGDIFEPRPIGITGELREFRVDLFATRLWLFRVGAPIRAAAGRYVERLRAQVVSAADEP
jgi:hypothetical protein